MYKIIDLALLINDVLVIGDLHIGYEEALNKQGILIPRFQFKDLVIRLKNILKQTNPKTIIINGDIKHEFGDISDQEWRDTLKIIDLLGKNSKLILIKGNHDTILGPIAKKRNTSVKDHYIIDGYYICHGHTIPNDKHFLAAKTVIIGHEHPAITLTEGGRSETYKCFLIGKYKEKQLIVMPSCNLVTEGNDVLTDEQLSPLLDNIYEFDVTVVSDKLYKFGKIRDLR